MNEIEEHLKALLASQAELVGSLTHDIKGLITGIEGGLYMIDSGLKKNNPDRIHQGNEMLRRNLARMRRTVGHSLYYVKDRDINPQSIDVAEILSNTVQSLQEYAQYLGVNLQERAKPGSFEGDTFAVQSMLTNLAEYALETSHTAGSSSTVTLSGQLNEQGVQFEVLLQGTCIPEDVKERILNAYYSPRGGDRSHLCVFIARKLVLAHRGTLSIETSEAKKTTAFGLLLPRAPASSTEP